MKQTLQENFNSKYKYTPFDIKNLTLESNLAFDICIKKGDDFTPVIKKNTFISKNIYDRLAKHTKLYVLIHKQLNCLNIQHFIAKSLGNNDKILQYLYTVNEKNYTYLLSEHFREDTQLCITQIVETIIYIFKNNSAFLKNSVNYFSHEYNLAIHSLHVAIYAINLGNALNFSHEKLVRIGIAGLLHDIGVKTIDQNILNKNTPLNSDEIEIIHNHPKESVLIVEHNHIHDPYIIDAIAHHHERYDGSGYPNRLLKQQIGEEASIIGICDTFDALTNERPYRKRFTYFEALKFMLKDKSMVGKFNTEYLQAFLKSLI
jgi:HD-GYP domain-containing protein (c-di-GMP phosphodiesterase class II)